MNKLITILLIITSICAQAQGGRIVFKSYVDASDELRLLKSDTGLVVNPYSIQINKLIDTLIAFRLAINAADTLKVDKISGKGLSTEDYTSSEKAKLLGIATSATQNSSDATLLNRANHTGTQPGSTISDFQSLVSANSYVANSVAHYGRTDNPHGVTLQQVGYDSAVDHSAIWTALNARATASSLTSVAYVNTNNNFSSGQTISGQITQLYDGVLKIKSASGAATTLGIDFRDFSDFGIGRLAQNTGTGDLLLETHSGNGNPEIKLVYDTRGVELGGPLRFKNYTVGILKSDASGNVSVSSSLAQSNVTGLPDSLSAHRTSLNTAVRTIATRRTTASWTGSTAETTVYTATVPANTLGANGSLHFISTLKWSNNANAKTMRIKVNGTTIYQYGPTTNQTLRAYTILSNRNATNVQVAGGPTGGTVNAGFNSASTSDVATFTFDTTADLTITLTVQLGNSGDTAGWEDFEIIAHPFQ